MNVLGILVFSMAFEMGMTIDHAQFMYIDNTKCFTGDYYYASFEIEAEILKYLYVKGSLLNIFDKSWSYAYSPLSETYFIEGGVNFNGLVIGVNHACYHPITTYGPILMTERKLFQQQEGSVSTLFIRIELGGKNGNTRSD
jgi:hypothetical protein